MKTTSENPFIPEVTIQPYPATKLQVPKLTTPNVQRPRLLQALNNGSNKKVTQIIAPTGYGKTTLLSKWLLTVRSLNFLFAWITLDSSDNDLLSFWMLLLSGIRKAYPNFGVNAKQIHNDPIDLEEYTVLNPFINEIAQIPSQVYLILDDVQEITDNHIFQSLYYLITHQPANMHLILSSRENLQIPLARLRVQGQLVEINSRDLAFTQGEARAFLIECMKLKIEPEQLQQIIDTTGGWIAGLKLVAFAIKQQNDAHFLDNHLDLGKQWILEYLTEEVINRQSEDIRNFLLKTSILSDLSAPLCDAVLQRSDSQVILQQIEKANLFIDNLDVEKHWYRYQELFAQLLRTLLERTQPEIVPELHHRAHIWLIRNGYPDKAITHALSPQDLENTAKMMDEKTIQVIIKNDLVDFVHWLGRFSNNLFDNYPDLCVHYALANLASGRFAVAEKALQKAEDVLNNFAELKKSKEDEKKFKWEIATLRSVLNLHQGNLVAGIAQFNQALQAAPESVTFFYGFLNQELAQAYEALDDYNLAIDKLENACQFALRYDFKRGFVNSLFRLARIHKLQGQLTKAEKEYRQVIEYAFQAGLDHRSASMAFFGLADIAVERNELETASHLIQPILDEYHSVESITSSVSDLVFLSSCLSRFYLANHGLDNALLNFRIAQRGIDENRGLFISFPFEYTGLQIHLWVNQAEAGSGDCIFEENLSFLNDRQELNLAEQVALARYLMAQNKISEALSILDQIEKTLYIIGKGELLIKTLLLGAICSRKIGENSLALQMLKRAILMAEPEGYVRIFTDEGCPIYELLLGFAQQPGQNETEEDFRIRVYAQKLTGVLEQSHSHMNQGDCKPDKDILGLFQSSAGLSMREKEVLEQLKFGRSTKEIASVLKVSTNTVRTHLKKIYRKLGEHNKEAVILRAVEWGIIDESREYCVRAG